MRSVGFSSTWKSIAVGLFAWALFGVGSIFSQGGQKSDAEVKIFATASKPDEAGKQTVSVVLKINEGWHVYANPVKNSDFTSAQTVMTINAKVKPAEVKIRYPEGKTIQDKVIGNLDIYENKVTIQATVTRAEGDTSPLELSVRFMACGEKGQCLLPATVKLTVPNPQETESPPK